MIDRNSFEPLYSQICRDIEQQILDGTIQIGDKLMSEAQMQRYYRVGRMTVRAALTELVNSGCVKKEQGLGTFCIALPNRPAGKKIDVLLHMGQKEFSSYFLAGISRVLHDRDANLVLHDTLDDMRTIAQLLRRIALEGTDGIILQPYTGVTPVTEECLAALRLCLEAKIPLVTIDGKFKGVDTSCVMNDDNRGGYLAACHAVEMGHRKILGLFRNRFKDSAFRSAGFRQAIEEAQLDVDIADYDQLGMEALIEKIRAEKITALVCYNDYLAVKCYHAFDRVGLKIPEDVSVIGYDDTELATASLPEITSVTHPKDRMGERTARMVLDMVEEGQTNLFRFQYQPNLVIRSSVKRLP